VDRIDARRLRLRRRLCVVLAGVVLVLLGSARPASAHTGLEAVDPAPGSSVPDDVRVIRLTFSDPVSPDGAVVELVPETGAAVPLGVQGGASSSVLTAAIPAGTTGAFAVRWRASSADGHPVEGRFGLGFGGAAAPSASVVAAIGPAETTPAVPGEAAADRARQLLTIGRVAAYLGLAVLVGGWCFVSLVWPAGAATRRTRGLLWIALGAAAAGTALGYAAEGALLQRDLGALGSPDAWREVLELPFGRAWAARLALLVLAVPLVRSLTRHGAAAATAPWWRVAAAAVGIGLLRTPGFVAHATEGDGGAVGSVADLVHLVGIAAWLGGLVVLCAVVLPRRRVQELAVVVPRFSSLAMIAMVAIVVGGTVMSWQLLDGVSSLWSTEFGRLLAAKLAVFGLAIAAAQRSKRWVDRRLGLASNDDAGDDTVLAVRPFVLSAATEVVLAVAAVAIASVLVSTNPPT
jgi:putative copper export protein/methionine-rich copper-binding protein CopC